MKVLLRKDHQTSPAWIISIAISGLIRSQLQMSSQDVFRCQAIVEVPDERVIPEVNLLSTPSYCLKPTGTVNLEVVTPECTFWPTSPGMMMQLNAQVGLGPASYELPAGFYRASFVSSEGCENEAVVEVGTEILSYNLVSANGDNNNDTWIIDCLENFPTNNVKVFNRSGVKVYEADGYNNV